MAGERRSLIDGLKATPEIDPKLEKDYVYRKPGGSNVQPVAANVANAGSVARVAISTRMRTDFAEALRRASLQRQLEKVEPNSLVGILEDAVEPWLREKGYIS